MDSAWGSIEKGLRRLNLECCRSRRILLMGRIEHACRIADWLRAKGLKAEAILDNDRKKQGLYAGDLPIMAPGQVLHPFSEDCFIMIYSPKYWEDMCAQLAEYGYAEGKHIYILDRPGLYKNIRLVKRGLCLYRRLQREYGRDVLVFLANCPLGDYYLLGLYFRQYCEENGIENYVVAGMSRGIEKLSPLFRFKAVRRLTGEESSALIRAWIFLGEGAVRLKPLTIWQGEFRFNPCQARQKNGFSFLDTFTKMIYSLDSPVPRHPAFPRDREAVEAIFRKMGLQQDRTVLLSPFSYSLQPLPPEFWRKVAGMIKERGYSVAVNVGEEREQNFIEDTVPLHLDFPRIMDAMELAGTVIGMRSGFFDITARARCRRVVLYPPSTSEDAAWNSTDIGFCSLERMGLCGDALEWEVEDAEEICRRILDVL